MSDTVRRLFVEKREGFNGEAGIIYTELQDILRIVGLSGVRLINRYDVQGLSGEDFIKAASAVFSEPMIDDVFYEDMEFAADEIVIATEPLPGQYDQQADWAAQCARLISGGALPLVRCAKIVAMRGAICADDVERVKRYLINPIERREIGMAKYATLTQEYPPAPDIEIINGFIAMDGAALSHLRGDMNLVMSMDDLAFCASYFKEENRDPTVAELRIIDTYWSDHCRHTTFLTGLTNIHIDGAGAPYINDAFDNYMKIRAGMGEASRPVTFMDIAIIAAKKARRDGKLADLEVSDEVNASSFELSVDIGDGTQDWLVMFKNETHNHPTEIEPLGGAATCLGGAIRDPLSGRSFVYQAMRVTGSADPRVDVADTIAGKLPQRKITQSAAEGYSLYGNQIGVPAGHVREIYHPRYMAKRLELGAVVSAAPKKDVLRIKPTPGDAVILLGGRTGRDGIGGATGSSKKLDEGSLVNCGAEVQKGSPPIERCILRLFRKPQASRLIKKCNDFGAGGVSVAVGELAAGLSIDLDKVPLKYEGLDGTEIALSESQERMAVVVAGGDAEKFIGMAADENLEATVVARVTDSDRMVMHWRGSVICDLSRGFLDSNGAARAMDVSVDLPDIAAAGGHLAFGAALDDYTADPARAGGFADTDANALKREWLANLADLNVCSQAGLVGMFDSTAGGGAVLAPYGGKYQRTPVEGMAAKIPVPGGASPTATLMTYGFDPYLSSASPYHGALYAVVESLAKLAALGGNAERAKLSFQEFFEQPGADPARWGKPLAALLGALRAQLGFEIAAVGGKDSMSGSFEDMDVPPTLVSFAIAPSDAREILSPEFKHPGDRVVLLASEPDPAYPGALLPDITRLKRAYAGLYDAIRGNKVLAAYAVREGGIAAAISMMCFGNGIGFKSNTFNESFFTPIYGSIVLELAKDAPFPDIIPGARLIPLGETLSEPVIIVGNTEISIDEAITAWEAPLGGVFPIPGFRAAGGTSDAAATTDMVAYTAADTTANTTADSAAADMGEYISPGINMGADNRRGETGARGTGAAETGRARAGGDFAKPRVTLVVAPGANGEYESAYAFERAGARTRTVVIKNNSAKAIAESVDEVSGAIAESEIIMLPGGYGVSGGPDVCGVFMAVFLRNERLAGAMMDFLANERGLALGISGGFRALILSGLLPGGILSAPISPSFPAQTPSPSSSSSPSSSPNGLALTANKSGRFISRAIDIVVCDNTSPWLSFARPGAVYTMPLATAEGRLYADAEYLAALTANGQIAARFAGPDGLPTMLAPYNPGGSEDAIAAITSPGGRVFGMLGHPERINRDLMLLKNIRGETGFEIFKSGVEYFM